jgi:hypothetical protein
MLYLHLSISLATSQRLLFSILHKVRKCDPEFHEIQGIITTEGWSWLSVDDAERADLKKRKKEKKNDNERGVGMYQLLITDLMQTRFNKDQEDGHIHLNVID